MDENDNILWSVYISTYGNRSQVHIPPLRQGVSENWVRSFAEKLSKVLQDGAAVNINAHQINPAKGYIKGGICKNGIWKDEY